MSPAPFWFPRGGPPPWWPSNEPWPPRSSRRYYDARRNRWARRSGWYSFVPVWFVLWFVFSGMWGRHSWLGAGFPSGVQLLVVCGVVAGVVAVVIRQLASPVADIVSAAERIKRRDYRARIAEPEHGPAWVRDTARAFNAMATELESQDTARRQMMADIAHELRTPLAVVQGKVEGLIDGVYPRDDAALQGVLEDTRVLARLVDDLRTLATAESGSLALVKEPTDLVTLAHDVAASLETRGRDAGVAVGVDPPADEIEPVDADPVRIREVLTNLVANAIRYTPAGGRILIGFALPPGFVAVSVRDNGAGIPVSELPRIFDRFYKGASSSGSGLGLTIARNLVEAHGGSIRAESRPGSGTTMTFTLPR